MAKTDLTKKLLSRFDRLAGQRQNWETHWQEVADYMMPRKSDVTKKRSRGDKRMELIFDSSPLQSLELLAASLTRCDAQAYSLKTSPDCVPEGIFNLTLPDKVGTLMLSPITAWAGVISRSNIISLSSNTT